MKLTAKVVRDDDALWDAIVSALGSARKRRKLTKSILRLQDRLHRTISAKAWRTYLRLEVAVNARAAFENELLVRWAFDQGRRHERRR